MPETELGLVPEIYYDVIARLRPGAPFVALAFRSFSELRSLPVATMAAAAIFGSYLVGHLLATISAIWNPVLWNRLVLGRAITTLHQLHPLGETSVLSAFHELYRRIDYIASCDGNSVQY